MRALSQVWQISRCTFQFEKAALLRDQIKDLKHMIDGTKPEAKPLAI
jgi:protein-arginine kinase activator protein McsA